MNNNLFLIPKIILSLIALMILIFIGYGISILNHIIVTIISTIGIIVIGIVLVSIWCLN